MNAVATLPHRQMQVVATIDDIERMAHAVARSGLFGARSPEQAMALMLVAQAEGLHPASAARDYDIISGRPAKKSEAMLRDFIKAGGAVRWHQLDDAMADATFSHEQGGEVRIQWDMNRAATTGLAGKDMWKKWPRQMLRSRCLSEGIRTVCPLATGGMYVPEEVQDIASDRPEMPPVVVSTAPPAVTDRPAYPVDRFAENLPKWAELIHQGKKSAEQIVAMIETKAALTAEQKAAITKLEPQS